MPHLRFRGMKPEQVRKLSVTLASELAGILQTPVDHFTFEHLATQFFNEGLPSEGSPFVEVLWFERSAEKKTNCAQLLTERIRQIGGNVDVTIVFRPINPEDYFENGTHF